jgi:hypothetical protein
MSIADIELEEAAIQKLTTDKEISIWELECELNVLALSAPHPTYEILLEVEDIQGKIETLQTEIKDLKELGLQ